jgi:sorbitol-specific phosphotransferase system component IIBC
MGLRIVVMISVMPMIIVILFCRPPRRHTVDHTINQIVCIFILILVGILIGGSIGERIAPLAL